MQFKQPSAWESRLACTVLSTSGARQWVLQAGSNLFRCGMRIMMAKLRFLTSGHIHLVGGHHQLSSSMMTLEKLVELSMTRAGIPMEKHTRKVCRGTSHCSMSAPFIQIKVG